MQNWRGEDKYLFFMLYKIYALASSFNYLKYSHTQLFLGLSATKLT